MQRPSTTKARYGRGQMFLVDHLSGTLELGSGLGGPAIGFLFEPADLLLL